MPKSMFVDPAQVRGKGKITFQDIPLNVYNKTAEQELREGNLTREDLLAVYHDMYVIRTFEEMLHSIKIYGKYKEHTFSYTGPAHLAIGEEAYAVGEAFLLNRDDFVFGGHRGHHEIIAKAYSAIRKLSDETLLHIMETYHGGAQYKVIRQHFAGEDIHHVFKRFYRSKRDGGRQGIGLGLPLVKSIVEGQDGMISVSSSPGEGSVFTISFLTNL